MDVDYTFEEFLSHLRAMETVMGYTEARVSYSADSPTVPLGELRHELANTLRILDYFAQQYEGAELRKVTWFVAVYAWLCGHFDAIAAIGDAYAASNGRFWFRSSALEAAFTVFKANRWETPALETVLVRAKELRKQRP